MATRPAPEQEITAVEDIHAALAGPGFPREHLAGGGSLTPDAIARAAVRWGHHPGRARRDDPRGRPGFPTEDVRTGGQARTLTCPRSDQPAPQAGRGGGRPRLPVLFPGKAGRECPARLQATGNLDGRGRHITVLPRPQQEIQTRVRAGQDSAQWRARYALRAGCEATVPEIVHAHGLRHCRHHGLAKTHVQRVLTAAGASIIRLSECYPPGTMPGTVKRPATPFQRLCQRLWSGQMLS